MRALAVSSLVPVLVSGAEKETLARAETRDLPFGPFESSVCVVQYVQLTKCSFT